MRTCQCRSRWTQETINRHRNTKVKGSLSPHRFQENVRQTDRQRLYICFKILIYTSFKLLAFVLQNSPDVAYITFQARVSVMFP